MGPVEGILRKLDEILSLGITHDRSIPPFDWEGEGKGKGQH